MAPTWLDRTVISVLILTRNEERDLPGCLASVAWSDDVHVLDSHSTDATAAMAVAAGARVHLRVFDDYSRQRNHGLHELPYRHPWLLILDADERIPPAAAAAMQQAVATAGPEQAAYRLRRRDFLHGRWLKHVQASPFYLRLVRPARCRYTPRIVNEVLEADGTISDLTQPFDHFPFSKGIDFWLERHNRYARMEAEQILADRREGRSFSLVQALLARDFHQRRKHQKELFYRLPCRPLFKFLLLYVLKRGFLDGGPGLLYARLQCLYERMIVLKVQDSRLAARAAALDQPAPPVVPPAP